MSDVLLLNPAQVITQLVDGGVEIAGALTVQGPLEPGGLNVAQVANGTVLLDGRLGRSQSLVLTESATVEVANWLPGLPYAVCIRQDRFGGRTVTWPASFRGTQAINPAPNGATRQMWIQDEAGNYYPLNNAVWS